MLRFFLLEEVLLGEFWGNWLFLMGMKVTLFPINTKIPHRFDGKKIMGVACFAVALKDVSIYGS